MAVIDQEITDTYAIWNSDCIEVLRALPDESVGLIIESPPFGSSMYNHSSDERDLSNCKDYDEFFEQYRYVVSEQSRVIQSGRMACIHCADISMGSYMIDLPGHIVKLYEDNGFDYCGRITCWKEPLAEAIRTRALSLRQSQIVKDATRCFPASPQYILLLRRKGTNANPVTHPEGLIEYHGETDTEGRLKISLAPIPTAQEQGLTVIEKLQRAIGGVMGGVMTLQERYKEHKDPQTNKWSHWIWQHYASSVWMDARNRNVLPFKNARETPEERHPHPTQLDYWDRCLQMYSNPKDKVWSSFVGVGSEIFTAVRAGRFGMGAELKSSYYRQALENLKQVDKPVADQESLDFDDELGHEFEDAV